MLFAIVQYSKRIAPPSRSTSASRPRLYRRVDAHAPAKHAAAKRRARDRKSLKLRGHQVADRHFYTVRAHKRKLREKALHQGEINSVPINSRASARKRASERARQSENQREIVARVNKSYPRQKIISIIDEEFSPLISARCALASAGYSLAIGSRRGAIIPAKMRC